MLLFTALLSAVFAAPSAPSSSIDIGASTTTNNCGIQYESTECDAETTAFGDKDSLRVVQYVFDKSVTAVSIVPSATKGVVNGLSKTYAVNPKALVEMSAHLQPIGGSSRASLTLVFKDKNGKPISSETEQEDVKKTTTLSMSRLAPDRAASVSVLIGAADESLAPSIDGELVLTALDDDFDDFYVPAECMPADCEACYITCDADEVKVTSCEQIGSPHCITINVCACEKVQGGPADQEVMGSWL